jgi:hypothetical protein
MRKHINILSISLFAILSFSCNKEVINNGDQGTSSEIILDNCIQFETGISTKGTLMEDKYMADNFDVYGYVYRSSWEAAKAMAKPNVFIDNAKEYIAPMTVTHDNGTYTYAPLVQWTGYKYSFFAYYPSVGTENTDIVPSGIDVEGEPYVTIKIPRNTTKGMFDFMTASYIDTDANSSKTVQLDFHHRLTAVDVGALNYCEYDPNPNNNDNTDVMPVTIQISQVDFEITNMLYDESQISLNRAIPSVSKNHSANTIANISIQSFDKVYSNDKQIKQNTDGDIMMRPISNSAEGTTMILIPQREPLHVTPSIRYYKRLLPDENGQARFIDHDGSIKYMTLTDEQDNYAEPPTYTYTTAFDFERPLLEGRRYYIQLNFTTDAVSLNIVAADEWNEDRNADGIVDDKYKIYHEFE